MPSETTSYDLNNASSSFLLSSVMTFSPTFSDEYVSERYFISLSWALFSYMRLSARWYISSTVLSVLSLYSEIPEAITGPWPILMFSSICFLNVFKMFSRSLKSLSIITTANSSPPTLKTGLCANVLQISLQASLMSSSPALCPWVSLTSLRSLTSHMTIPKGSLILSSIFFWSSFSYSW